MRVPRLVKTAINNEIIKVFEKMKLSGELDEMIFDNKIVNAYLEDLDDDGVVDPDDNIINLIDKRFNEIKDYLIR